MPLATIKKLSLKLGNAWVVKDVSLEIGEEKFGLVGESGSGKTLLAKTLLGTLPTGTEVEAETLDWKGKDLKTLSEKEWRKKIRGKEIAMILQDPKASLNPLMKIGKQLQEVAVAISPLSALREVSLSPQVLDMYPYQLSGGMGQRVMIAMMLMQHPKLLIADEIVSALDASLQEGILQLIQKGVDQENMSLIWIGHDLRQACRFCDRIGVMKEGQMIAVDTPEELEKHDHPYLRRLFEAALLRE
ncbi:MAG: ABC transporter ATP-binding protein [Waddliaceae bacterium]